MWAKCCRFGRELAVSIFTALHLSCSYIPNVSILLTAALADKASSYLLLHSPQESPGLLVSPQEVNFSIWGSFSPLHIKSSHWQGMNERQESVTTEITGSIICLTWVNSWGLSDSALALFTLEIHSVFMQRKYLECFENSFFMVSSSKIFFLHLVV